MLVTVVVPVLPSASGEPARLLLSGGLDGDVRAAAELRRALASVAAHGSALVIDTEPRPYVSDALIDAARVAPVAAGLVVVVAPVTDTMRDATGALVDRHALVEVGSPIALAADVVGALASDPSLEASVASIIAAAIAAGADVATIPDDGSSGWAGTRDHDAVARARVGR